MTNSLINKNVHEMSQPNSEGHEDLDQHFLFKFDQLAKRDSNLAPTEAPPR